MGGHTHTHTYIHFSTHTNKHKQHWDDGWRISYGGKSFFSILLLVLMFWLPESPRWLVAQDRDEEVSESVCVCLGMFVCVTRPHTHMNT